MDFCRGGCPSAPNLAGVGSFLLTILILKCEHWREELPAPVQLMFVSQGTFLPGKRSGVGNSSTLNLDYNFSILQALTLQGFNPAAHSCLALLHSPMSPCFYSYTKRLSVLSLSTLCFNLKNIIY